MTRAAVMVASGIAIWLSCGEADDIKMQSVADPGFLMSLGVALGVDATDGRQVRNHLWQRHLRLPLQPARFLFGPLRGRPRLRFGLAGLVRLRGRRTGVPTACQPNYDDRPPSGASLVSYILVSATLPAIILGETAASSSGTGTQPPAVS